MTALESRQDSPAAIAARVRAALRNDGVRAGLRILNESSSHRFTAVFRFEDATLRNLHLIDREDPKIERSPDLPVLESYCVYVRQTSRKFSVEDSKNDERVAGHPKQQTVQSYCGVPLFTPEGEMFGTICHFDFDPIPFSEEETMVLDEIAPEVVAAILRTEWRAPARLGS